MRSVELRRVALFAGLAPAHLVPLRLAARSRDYRRGDRLFCAGDPCAGVGVVLDGVVRVWRPMSDGAEVTTAIVRAGDLLTVCALRGASVHDDYAEALGRVRTVEVPTAALLAAALRSPPLLVRVMQIVAARLDDAHAAAVVDAWEQVPARVLHLLRCLAPPDAAGRRSTEGATDRLAIRPSHHDLARLVGTDRATVTRALRVLEERGLIQRARGHVTGVVPAAAGSAVQPRGSGGAASA